jgi:hypothetical protein
MSDWRDPWQWQAYRRMRRATIMGTVLLTFALASFLPAGWILMMPSDPTLRPELHQVAAWIILGLCGLAALLGLSWSSRARDTFEVEVNGRLNALREQAMIHSLDLDIEIADTYPPMLLSRRFRKIGFAGPDCLILPMDPVEVSAAPAGTAGDGPPFPHVVLRFPGAEPDRVRVAPGEISTSWLQAEVLAEKLRDYLDPRITWDRDDGPGIDMAAFIDSMRPK